MSAPVILSNGSIGLPLAGNLLRWGPIQLANYTLDMYGGYGSVEMFGTSVLIDSSLILQGSQANLINDGILYLWQSQASIADGSLAGTGPVVAMHGSTITVASSVPSQISYPLYPNAPDPTVTAPSSSQYIVLDSSTLNITGPAASTTYGGASTFFTTPVVMDAASTINIEGIYSIDPGKSFGVYAIDGGAAGLGTVNIQNGPVSISGAAVSIDANVAMTGGAGNHYNYIEIQGGRLMLAGSVTGGNISIADGALEFSRSPSFMYSPEAASENFHSTLDFAGTSDAVQFDGVTGGLSLNVNLSLADITVFNHGQQIADFHLAPGPSYTAAEFSVHGNQLLFHHS